MNTVDTSATYAVAPVFGTTCRNLKDPLMAMVRSKYLFKICGKALPIDSSNFLLDDGSPTKVMVVARLQRHLLR